MEEKLCCAKVGRRPEITVAGTDAVASLQLSFGFGEDPLGGRTPFVVPAIGIAGSDAVYSGQNFVKFACAVAVGPEGALCVVPELNIVGKDWRLGRRSLEEILSESSKNNSWNSTFAGGGQGTGRRLGMVKAMLVDPQRLNLRIERRRRHAQLCCRARRPRNTAFGLSKRFFDHFPFAVDDFRR